VIGVLPIPKLFLESPHARDKDKVSEIKSFCDVYYKNPPIPIDDILNGRLHSVYLINIDKNFAKELDPCSYLDLTEKLLDKSEVSL